MKVDLHPNLTEQKTLLKQLSKQSVLPDISREVMLLSGSTVQHQNFIKMVYIITQNLKVLKEQEKLQKNRLISLNSLYQNILLIRWKTVCLKVTGMDGRC